MGVKLISIGAWYQIIKLFTLEEPAAREKKVKVGGNCPSLYEEICSDLIEWNLYIY